MDEISHKWENFPQVGKISHKWEFPTS